MSYGPRYTTLNCIVLWFKFLWCMILKVQLTISQLGFGVRTKVCRNVHEAMITQFTAYIYIYIASPGIGSLIKLKRKPVCGRLQIISYQLSPDLFRPQPVDNLCLSFMFNWKKAKTMSIENHSTQFTWKPVWEKKMITKMWLKYVQIY